MHMHSSSDFVRSALCAFAQKNTLERSPPVGRQRWSPPHTKPAKRFNRLAGGVFGVDPLGVLMEDVIAVNLFVHFFAFLAFGLT